MRPFTSHVAGSPSSPVRSFARSLVSPIPMPIVIRGFAGEESAAAEAATAAAAAPSLLSRNQLAPYSLCPVTVVLISTEDSG